MDEEKIRKYWLEFANRYCNQNFKEDKLPYVVELFLDGKVKEFNEGNSKNVQSERLSDMSITYFEKKLSKEEENLLSQVRKLKVP